ncbi:Hypothetical protein RLITU_1490 [Romboutsia lituseburensis]|nr:Hypothetical protein RLITU_1490 [Romboutsia lituseburensis]
MSLDLYDFFVASISTVMLTTSPLMIKLVIDNLVNIVKYYI